MEFDLQGVILAEVPNAGVSRIDPNAESGNARHDIASGKFGSGGPGRKPNVETPPNTDALGFARMLDAARTAARLFDNPQSEELQKFLAGKAANPEAVDLNQFLALVIEWKKNDLVDLLDSQLKGAGSKVKMTASRSFVKASLGGLDANAQAEVLHRLEARGHDKEDLDRLFAKKVDKPDKAIKKRDQLAASLEFSEDMLSLVDADKKSALDAIELTGNIVRMVVSELPPPVVNIQPPEVHVSVPEQKSLRKIVKRDDRGMISEVIDAE